MAIEYQPKREGGADSGMSSDGSSASGTADVSVGSRDEALSGPPPLPGVKPADSAGGTLGDDRLRPAQGADDTSANAGANAGAEPPSRRLARRRPAGPTRGRIAANDDAPSIGGLIYALEQKPSDKPFRFAAVASGLWTVVWLVFAAVMVYPHVRDGASVFDVIARSNALLIVAAIFVPVTLFWFLAVLAWRTEELKLRSSTMTEVAIRLAEPDRMAEQSIASLGQAVRRQVSFMNDAVARALGRAGELEALVHNEVSALERSYEENERKIRGLIQELAGERHALVNTSERVSDTLRGLGSEIPALIERLSDQQLKLTTIIDGAGQNLTALESAVADTSRQLETTVATTTDRLQSSISTSTGMLETTLDGHASRLQNVLEDYTSGLGVALEVRTQQMQDAFEGHASLLDERFGARSGEIEAALTTRTETLEAVLEEYARALDTSMETRTQALDMQLVERTRALDDAFSERLKIFDESVLRSTMAIDGAISERSAALTAALEDHARNMSDVVGKQAIELDETLMNGINAVRRSSESITRQSLKAIEGLASQSDMLKNISENLLVQINNVTGRFEQQGGAIMRAATSLETANYRIDNTLQQRHAELNRTLDRLSGKADEMGEFLQGYSTSLEGSLSDVEQRARSLTEEISRGTESRSLAAIAELERLRQSTDTETQRALEDLRSKFSTVETEMSQHLGSLTHRVDETSLEVRQRAQRAVEALEQEQSRLRQQIDSLPQTAQASAEAMRRSLQDQLRALDQLSSLAHRQVQNRDVSPPVPLHATNVHAEPTGYMPPHYSDPAAAAHGAPQHGGMQHQAHPPAHTAPQAVSAPRQPAAPQSPPHTGPQGAPQGAASGDRARTLSSLTSGLGRELAARQQAQPTREPRGTPAPANNGSARENWSLGDLLARASVGEEHGDAAAAQGMAQGGGHMIEVAQIANALDAATASAIWSRLRAGQRGVMVRSIYPSAGRETFDEVSHRYANDGVFQETVNRYLADFERILREIEQKDPSGRNAQTYAVSETGRVYLFLAHASGRLA